MKILKKLLLATFIVLSFQSFSQFGVNYNLTRGSYFGLNYEFKNRFRPEFRVTTNNEYFLDAPTFEGVLLLDIIDKSEYEVYLGAGAGNISFYGLSFVLPIGLNMYPFTTKNFGFHIEIAPTIDDYLNLRGTIGIRYRFKKSE